MDFEQAIRSTYSKYFTISGRASRSEYWRFVVFIWTVAIVFVIFAFVLLVLAGMISWGIWVHRASRIEGFGLVAFLAASIVPWCTVTIRRLHDIGCSGGWIFLLLPFPIFLIIALCLRSQDGRNRFGEHPSLQPEPSISGDTLSNLTDPRSRPAVKATTPLSTDDAEDIPRAKPLIESAAQHSVVEANYISPWDRYFARVIDTIFVGWVSIFLILAIAPDFLEMGSGNLGFVVVLISPILLNALCLGLIGTTLGKSMFGIRVKRRDGSLLGIWLALKREMLVYLKGLGMGIPFVNIVTLYLAYLSLKEKKITAWDRDLGLVVVRSPSSKPEYASH
jgi:uncharacterized membrane protein YhaH (DUF805 family)/uncharacterized RDD family membrane protein YckC